MGYFWEIAKDLPADIIDHPFYRIIERAYSEVEVEEREAFLAVKTSEAIDDYAQAVELGLDAENAREQALAGVLPDSEPMEEWEIADAEEEQSSIAGAILAEMGQEFQALSQQRAPVGGATVQGEYYPGGQFIPGDVMERATPEERRAIEAEAANEKRQRPTAPKPKPKQKQEPPARNLESVDSVLGAVKTSLERLKPGQGLFVRYSSSPERDLIRGTSMDHSSGQVHAGLSAVEIYPELSDFEKRDRLVEYGFIAAMAGRPILGWLAIGQKVGVDSDNSPVIKVEEVVGTFDPKIAVGMRRQTKLLRAEKAIADAEDKLKVVTDRIAIKIWKESLEEAKEDYKKALSELAPEKFQTLALQPGVQKVIGGKTYVLNRNHRWTLPQEAEAEPARAPRQGAMPARRRPNPAVAPREDMPLEQWKAMAPKTVGRKSQKKWKQYLEDAKLIDYIPDRKPTAQEAYIAEQPGDSMEQRRARMVVARDFLQTDGLYYDFGAKEMRPLDYGRVAGMLEGIDFSEPVVIGPPPSVPPPRQMGQWQAPGGLRGGYFAPVGTRPADLGLGELSVAWGIDGRPIKARVAKTYRFPPPGVGASKLGYIRSTAAPIVDNWGVEGFAQPAGGGGTQWFIPMAANPQVQIDEISASNGAGRTGSPNGGNAATAGR